MSVPDSSCGAQSAWHWDCVNGDDTADGWTAATAVKTFAEVERRTRLCPMSQSVVVTVHGNPTERPNITRLPGPGILYFTGAPDNTLYSGTVDAVVQEDKGANQPCTITCNAIADGGWTQYLDKMLRVYDANGVSVASPYIQRDLGGKTAQLGAILNIDEGPGNMWTPGAIAAGNTFAVVNHPVSLPGPISAAPITIVYHGVGYHGEMPPSGPGLFVAQMCEFDTAVQFRGEYGEMFSKLINCKLAGAQLHYGSAGLLDRCYVPGAELGLYTNEWRINDLRFFGRPSDPSAEFVLIASRCESITQEPIGVDFGFWDVASGFVMLGGSVTFEHLWGCNTGSSAIYAPLELRCHNNRVAFRRDPVITGQLRDPATGETWSGWRWNDSFHPWSELIASRGQGLYDLPSDSWIGYQTGYPPAT